MSGIVGSKLNIRGSGRVAKLGTDGQVLTSAGAGVSAVYEDAAGGGGAWTFIKSVTASADSSIDFVDGTDDVILDNTYLAYRIMGVNIAGDTDNQKIYIHFSDDTGVSWDNGDNYQTNIYKVQSNTAYKYNGTSDAFTCDSVGNTAYESVSFEYTVFDPSISDDYTHYSFKGVESKPAASTIMSYTGGGMYKSAVAVDGIRIVAATGNITGKAFLYGLARS